jgi:methylase of polypeptide subunit release factors
MANYSQVEYGSILVSFTPELDGGGNTFGRAYAPFVETHFGKVDELFEWCAGPGFIGFSLLAAGLCGRLDLGDINHAARSAVERTIEENHLEDQARFHLSDCFAATPPEARWDLMVGNPPHVNAAAPASEYQHTHSPLIWKDTDWSIHGRFYAEASRHLRPGGSVVIQENHRFSAPEDFQRMIGDSGLEIVGAFECGPGYEDYYFMWSRLPAATAL